MDIDEALLIVDPETRIKAMAARKEGWYEMDAVIKEAARTVAAEYRKVRATLDAAVADLEKLMLYGERVRCEFCGNDRDWCADREVCAPVWRGPQEAQT